VDSSGNIWVIDSTNGKVNTLNTNGGIIGSYNVGLAPIGITIDQKGNVWVINAGSNNATELVDAAQGPQYVPYKGPQFIGGGNW